MLNKKVVLYVTGSIAAYKSVYLLRELQRNGAEVRVVMTSFAEKFVSSLTFASLSKHFVYDDNSFTDDAEQIKHIELAKWADLSIVAPASADFIAKLANGIADNFALTTLLATDSRKIIVPAMNDVMFHNFATQNNLEVLKKNQITVLDTATGMLAEGYSAKGRMLEPLDIINQVKRSLIKTGELNNFKILVTAGGTQEDIDPVRVISNRSSGKMGYAIAEAAAQAGAEVTLISANCNLQASSGIKVVPVRTSSELMNTVLSELPSYDALIMAAAVSDFRVHEVAKQKIKKDPNQDYFELILEKTPDILKQVALAKQEHQLIVGFAAETQNFEKNAQKKLKAKGLNMIVLNDVSNPKIGFSSDDNQVTIIDDKQKVIKTEIASKIEIAQKIIEIVEQKLR
ncbi:bifunctional phosphopantothenoylcysteine decarboxylase/phosphopantothenate--cysteine ligase CoaBC [Fructilactobacillus vespulae]|uniref:bifunctional phosphopantothenoylcysteine decarboxylase/phosphopantothenate--cysteine ligase CoaBC n=1 Tax=Fructilactobacillus vespulae TaxID=1249630 RepID=UPI0039B3E06E